MNRVPRPQEPRLRDLVLCLVLPALTGIVVAALADDWTASRWMLVCEPLTWLLASIGAVYMIETDRGAYGISSLVGLLLFAAFIRFPVTPATPTQGLHLAMAECATPSQNARATITVASASWTSAPDFATTLETWDSDLLVVSDIPEQAVLPLAMRLERAAISSRDDVAVLVRGRGVPCAGKTAVRLPGALGTLTQIDNLHVPLFALASADAADLKVLAAGALDLAHPHTLVLGATKTHGTFRRTEATMLGAELASASHQATFPAEILGLPALPLYHSDRLWMGPGWRVAKLRTERIPGSRRLALIARLESR